MQDLISRQAAIEETWKEPSYTDPLNVLAELRDRIKDLPSAQPDLDEWCTDCSEYDQERHCCPRWNRVIRQTLKDAQPERKTGEWIPCSERLPDGRLNKSYLVQDKDGRRAVGTYTNWGWVFGHYMNDPVAWMPLPEPWKEKPNEIH